MAEPLHSEKQSRELDPEIAKRRNELFQKYVSPYYNMVYKLVMKYSYQPSNVPENYNEVLVNLYRGIDTYDPERSIKTWIHIVTKRHVYELERRRQRDNNKDNDHDIESYEEVTPTSDKPSSNMLGVENYRDFYSDDILEVLDMMRPLHRDALILQEAGYSLKEIADIEYKKGTLRSHNVETVKSRLYLARQFMKRHLTRDGKRKMD